MTRQHTRKWLMPLICARCKRRYVSGHFGGKLDTASAFMTETSLDGDMGWPANLENVLSEMHYADAPYRHVGTDG